MVRKAFFLPDLTVRQGECFYIPAALYRVSYDRGITQLVDSEIKRSKLHESVVQPTE
jgi:hypothetical protein